MTAMSKIDVGTASEWTIESIRVRLRKAQTSDREEASIAMM
jgi:hypothetical protein